MDLNNLLKHLRSARGRLSEVETRLERIGTVSVSDYLEEIEDLGYELSSSLDELDQVIVALGEIEDHNFEEAEDLDECITEGDPEKDLSCYQPSGIGGKALKAAFYRQLDRINGLKTQLNAFGKRVDDIKEIQKSQSQEIEGLKRFLRRERGYRG